VGPPLAKGIAPSHNPIAHGESIGLCRQLMAKGGQTARSELCTSIVQAEPFPLDLGHAKDFAG
jgi:hypothetical protein